MAEHLLDASQITGSASSYARKYALNGLLCIDDTKNADTMDNSQPTQHATVRAEAKTSNQTDAETTFSDNGDFQDAPTEVVFNGGKYAGKPVKTVTDFGYLKWVVEKSSMKPEIKKAAQDVLDDCDVA